MAGELRATGVLQGSVDIEGNLVALDLRLVTAPSGRVLWSFSEQRSFSALPALSGELARQVVAAIGARAVDVELGRAARPHTTSTGAYDSYLRATALDESNVAQNEAGMDLLREAIRQDSTYAMAWATLARRFVFHGYFVSPSYRDSGLAAVGRALALNPELDEAHFVNGDLLVLSGRPATARYSFLKAIELNPSHAAAMADLSDAEATTGRFDQSLYWAMRALALYPNSPMLYHHASVPLLHLGDDAAALRWLEAGERRWPDFGRLQGALLQLELKQGRHSAALARIRRSARLTPTNVEARTGLAQIAWVAGAPDGDSLVLREYLAAPDARPFTGLYPFRTLAAATRLRHGDTRAGRALADTALRAALSAFGSGGEDPGPAVEAAAILALVGRKQESLAWLERAYQAGYRDYRWPRHDPFLRTLSGDGRFTRLLSRMESDVAVMRRRAAAAHDSLFAAGTS
jgi:tetratricopeptide (TPR) repeat protein